ncbi:hypothetical protein OGAPHI_007143 [Ogataea philodendri]|uniref:Zn(2)-C6 fungal-type domain-containing protein n=1 Tax=Ogataea philodendri TaxID=1378263 RepID=A0A9P8NVS5_9ASCO|nr:uncharacterized protein OGAPHI_007143 [Ogataea philodendri]KAH3660557.1 hypothetical protein OGAPHI_007143 [Ogataea philodendri]
MTVKPKINGQASKKVACIECRSRKLKCDMKQPACDRCVSKGLECKYITPRKTGPKIRVKNRLLLNQLEDNTLLFPDEHINTEKQSRHYYMDDELAALLRFEEFGFDIQAVNQMHDYYYNGEARSFHFSRRRYEHKLRTDPISILPLIYLIWANATVNKIELRKQAEGLYRIGCQLLEKYHEADKHSDSLIKKMYQLQAMVAKSAAELRLNHDRRSTLSICAGVRLAQLYGFDRIDPSPSNSTHSSFFTRTENWQKSFPLRCPDGRCPETGEFPILESSFSFGSFRANDWETDEFDEVDVTVSVQEEARRTFWAVYTVDKWFAVVTGLSSSFMIDLNFVVFTRLPSPTTFLSPTGEIQCNNQCYYLHEAMEKLQNDQVLVDFENSLSSHVLMVTVLENVTKWSRMFLNVVDLSSLKAPQSLHSLQAKVEDVEKNFDSLLGNLTFYDLNPSSLLQSILNHAYVFFSQAIFVKMSDFFAKEIKQNGKPSSKYIYSPEHTAFYKKILNSLTKINIETINKFLTDEEFEAGMEMTGSLVIFINNAKSLFHILTVLMEFGDNLGDEVPSVEEILRNLHLLRLKVDSRVTDHAGLAKLHTLLHEWFGFLNNCPQKINFFSHL